MSTANQGPLVRKLTLTASLAAIYVIFRAIPIDSLIGINGTITAVSMIAPVVGILLEPAYAIVAVFIGTGVAFLLPWNPVRFNGLDFLPGGLNVALVSLTARGKRIEAIMMFLMIIGLFIINPYTRLFVGSSYLSPPIPYLWMHFAALIVLISPLAKDLLPRLTSHQYTSLVRPIAVLAFAGTMLEHVTGGLLFAVVLNKGAVKFWPAIFVVYPIERAVLVIGATLICSTLLTLLSVSFVERSVERVTPIATARTSGVAGSGRASRSAPLPARDDTLSPVQP